jgi:hypothetical protein
VWKLHTCVWQAMSEARLPRDSQVLGKFPLEVPKDVILTDGFSSIQMRLCITNFATTLSGLLQRVISMLCFEGCLLIPAP